MPHNLRTAAVDQSKSQTSEVSSPIVRSTSCLKRAEETECSKQGLFFCIFILRLVKYWTQV